jgi:hypothetical protein
MKAKNKITTMLNKLFTKMWNDEMTPYELTLPEKWEKELTEEIGQWIGKKGDKTHFDVYDSSFSMMNLKWSKNRFEIKFR